MSKKVEKKVEVANLDTLKENFQELIEKRTELNVQHYAGQLKQTHQIKQVRRKIAEIKRKMHEMKAIKA